WLLFQQQCDCPGRADDQQADERRDGQPASSAQLVAFVGAAAHPKVDLPWLAQTGNRGGLVEHGRPMDAGCLSTSARPLPWKCCFAWPPPSHHWNGDATTIFGARWNHDGLFQPAGPATGHRRSPIAEAVLVPVASRAKVCKLALAHRRDV